MSEEMNDCNEKKRTECTVGEPRKCPCFLPMDQGPSSERGVFWVGSF